ncbi:MAG: hypothetical protein E7287_04805 [Lachnospiraceae bacterium]|nr:hypothetical protein [Lachnospiraceae bacterium]
MLKMEKPYEFKQELRQIHKKDRRDYALRPTGDELVLRDGIQILLPDYENEVIMTAATDFMDYLRVSMQLSSGIGTNHDSCHQSIKVLLCQELGDASGYMGHRITVGDDGIILEGYDDRGVAQGFYMLEDLMNLRKAPFLKKETLQRKALFSPRITHSPMGPFEYTDEALSIIAHHGFDAVELWIKEPNQTLVGYQDFNQICDRARKYGIDVYAEIYMNHTAHPDDLGAQNFYDRMYGELFEKCPGIKGITFLGEAAHFCSRDPKVLQRSNPKDITSNIPIGKIKAGWWPCCDYPKLISMIQKAVHKFKPDADIIFCTYNWGFQPEEERIKLIEALPEGISLLATWDMFHMFKVGEVTEYIADYSLQFVGPGEYFRGEAIAAKKKGMRLYSISNTSGRTWDFGVIPYEPMPYQWIKRYKAILKAREEWGLCGLVENIHYGFHPSFIVELEKWAFFTEVKPIEHILEKLLARDYGAENLAIVDRAMQIWSEAIKHCIPTNEDQYGTLRIGPSYPFWTTELNPPKIPSPPQAFWGNTIYHAKYTTHHDLMSSLPGVRLFAEIEEFSKLRDLLLEGIEVLKTIERPNDKLKKLINLGEFMYRTAVTTVHYKEFYVLLSKLQIAGTRANAALILDKLEGILHKEQRNVEETIPLVQCDSRLGWEPSMDYTTNEECLRWKLKQIEAELTYRIPMMRKSNDV